MSGTVEPTIPNPLGKTVLWEHTEAKVVGVMNAPSYILELSHGRRVTVAQSHVSPRCATRPDGGYWHDGSEQIAAEIEHRRPRPCPDCGR